jgi:hypothetical protein
MSYQYLFCATCGQRRTGHAFRCSVCGNELRRPDHSRSVSVTRLQPLTVQPREQRQERDRERVAA